MSNKIKDQMVLIPKGEIILRDDRIKREWTVELRPFYLSKYAVTQDLYFDVTQKSPSQFKGARNPVETVSWYDAVEFCNALSKRERLKECYSLEDDTGKIICDFESEGYRLPTEAEWEYACKAGTKRASYGETDRIAWYKGNSQNRTHEVGGKEPNGWGLYDMLGNVWEWCWDIYDKKVYGPYRVFRGGGWSDSARGCLSTNRRRSHPTFSIDDLGFRIARTFSS